jgi:hypothetical protein
MRRKNLEHNSQAALFKLIGFLLPEYPELDLLFAIPNGGARNIIVASRLKAEGVKPGVPDLMLPVARQGYHGLFIEMKIAPNRPTKHQKEWLQNLTDQGYLATVCFSTEEAINLIKKYLQKT